MATKLGALYYPKETDGKEIPFDTLFIPYIYREIYIEGLYVDILNGKKDLTILDVGANIGVVTQYMRPFAKVIHAIEPCSEHFAALRENKDYNGWDNVVLHNMALADTDGEMEMSKNTGNRTMNSLMTKEQALEKKQDYCVQSTTNCKYEDTEKVKTMAFDTFMAENKIDHIDFCKFDVEGAEDLILRSEGFKKVVDKIDAIEVEFHFANWQELVKYMIELGFKARRYESSAIVILFFK
jgi:FkbM family methyltransferase